MLEIWSQSYSIETFMAVNKVIIFYGLEKAKCQQALLLNSFLSLFFEGKIIYPQTTSCCLPGCGSLSALPLNLPAISVLSEYQMPLPPPLSPLFLNSAKPLPILFILYCQGHPATPPSPLSSPSKISCFRCFGPQQFLAFQVVIFLIAPPCSAQYGRISQKEGDKTQYRLPQSSKRTCNSYEST